MTLGSSSMSERSTSFRASGSSVVASHSMLENVPPGISESTLTVRFVNGTLVNVDRRRGVAVGVLDHGRGLRVGGGHRVARGNRLGHGVATGLHPCQADFAVRVGGVHDVLGQAAAADREGHALVRVVTWTVRGVLRGLLDHEGTAVVEVELQRSDEVLHRGRERVGRAALQVGAAERDAAAAGERREVDGRLAEGACRDVGVDHVGVGRQDRAGVDRAGRKSLRWSG